MKSAEILFYKSTPRLILRPLQEMDFINWQQTYANLGGPQNRWDEAGWEDSELTLKKFKELLKQQSKDRKEDKNYSLGVFLKNDGLLIGQVNLSDISRGIFQNAYLGYRIFNPYWGNGFAKEAVAAALDLGFKKLKLHRLEAGISLDNKASIKVAKALGLRKEGISKNRLKLNGKWEDIIIYARTKED